MADENRLVKLRTQGFKLPKPGKIHMRCPTCGRKQSNVERYASDPDAAFLAEIYCPKCASGAKDPPTYYYDASGEELELSDG